MAKLWRLIDVLVIVIGMREIRRAMREVTKGNEGD
jgi:hypothetical protein